MSTTKTLGSIEPFTANPKRMQDSVFIVDKLQQK